MILQKNIPILIIIAILAVLVVSGGIYWWQQSILEKAKNELQQQNNELQQQINNLQNQLTQTISEKNELQQQINEFTKKPEQLEQLERYVKIISPNGGETICLNEETIIEWESKGVDTVSVRVMKQAFEGGSYYYIGLNAVSATYNEEGISGKGETTWKVEGVPMGDGYKMEIMSAGLTSRVSDTSDGVFSIIVCEG